MQSNMMILQIIFIKYVRGRNLYSLRPYWELFLYLRGETENCKLYLSIFGKKGHTSHENYNDEKLLTDKREIYYLYLKELIGGSRSFFQDSPAEGGVTSNNRVVIYDGLRRSIFYLCLDVIGFLFASINGSCSCWGTGNI